MKKHFIFAALVALFFASCTGFFDYGEEKITYLNEDGKPVDQPIGGGEGGGTVFVSNTKIIFHNKDQNWKVDVFDLPSRNGSPLVTLNAGQSSDQISWFPDSNFYFYLTYYILLRGVEIPYIPIINKGMLQDRYDYVNAQIFKDQINPINITSLDELLPFNHILFPEAYLFINNLYNTAIRFAIGSGIQTPINGSSSLVNQNGFALYKISNPGNTSGYNILFGAQTIDFNTSENFPSALQGGYFYEVIISGSGANMNIELYGTPAAITAGNLP